jgi:hypothetical protein
MYKDIEHTFQLNNNYRTFNIRSEEPDGFDWSEVGIRSLAVFGDRDDQFLPTGRSMRSEVFNGIL